MLLLSEAFDGIPFILGVPALTVSCPLHQVYLDDAAGDRLWVDSEECRPFVDNVITAFGTRVSPKSMLQPDITLAGRPDCPSPPGAACEFCPCCL